MKGPFFRASTLLTKGIPRIDAHLHTDWTDGASNFQAYARRARELELEAIAFTEHTDDTSRWYEDYLALQPEIREMAAPTKVYFGAEAKVAHPSGALSLGLDRIRRLDFIVGVLHRYPDGNGGYSSFEKLNPVDAQELDFVLSRALLTNPLVDVWGHPGGVYAKYFGPYREEWLRELVALAATEGKVVEINTNPRYRSVFNVVFEECLARDCQVSLGSDAHHVRELGEAIRFLEQLRSKS